MVIIIGNQKGGAGKSTLTLLLANYLALAKKCELTVMDMDYQQSLAQKYEKAKVLENDEPYQVIAAGLEHFPDMAEVLGQNKNHIILVDLPGKLDDDGLIPLFEAADLVLCPFAYDEFSYESTILFSVVLRKINPDVAIIYIPNRIKANVKYETQLEVNEQLAHFGEISDKIPDRIDVQRTNTQQTQLSVYPVIVPVFSKIFEQYIKPNSL
ncbi:AAA family ATPase [Mucilaginibacter sp. UYCu711]|uniref:nucleotide-binding protein n=1 Tax=Mucilaginibacter sp. UYCu711 TaxID=3156339 RepID=UPI003D1B88DA